MADVRDILSRFKALRSTRDGYWQSQWKAVRRYCMPDMDTEQAEGFESHSRLFDTTAIQARERLASGMYTWMAPGDRKWFQLVPGRRDKGSPAVETWFSKCTDVLAFELANSNFPGELIKALNDLACGLDAVVYCEDGGPSASLNFRAYPIESVCYCTDGRDRLDTVFREMEMTSRQMADYFGVMADSSLPAEIVEEAADQQRCDTKHMVLHVVMPRRDRKPESMGRERMAYESLFVEEKSQCVVQEGGYEEMPYAICRFRKSVREQYGRGPGLDALPDIRMLNKMREAFIRNCEFSADPSWLVPDGSLVSRNFNRAPGGLIFFRPGLGNLMPQPVQRGNNPQLDFQVIENERQRIKDAFFWDVFDPLGDIRNMTAQEATIRNESKLVPFGPIACNIHNDLLSPLLERAFAILMRGGYLDAPPVDFMQEGTYRVEFVSRIALSMKRQSALGWLQTESTLQGLVQLNPAVMDNFDLDEIVRDVARSNGCEGTWLVDRQKREDMRQERVRQQEEQKQAEMAAQVASNAGQLGRRPEAGSPMQGLMEMAAQGGIE